MIIHVSGREEDSIEPMHGCQISMKGHQIFAETDPHLNKRLENEHLEIILQSVYGGTREQ